MEYQDIALRCFTETKQYKSKEKDFPQIPNRVLVFDTETTNDQYQNLLFGHFKIYFRSKLEHQGIFYNPMITDKQLKIIQDYTNKNNIELYTVQEFNDNIFYPQVYYLKALCVGFNLPFDISRIAKHFSDSRRFKGGFSFKLSDNPKYPWIRIMHIDSTMSFIQFNRAPSFKKGNNRNRKVSNNFPGNFLDLRTLTFALTNRKHTLGSACELFKADILKTKSEEYGKITKEHIEYNINDVNATYSLYLKLKDNFEMYNLEIPITKAYSPASIGKAYFKQMGIKPFLDMNPKFSREILGYIMNTYYGGRCEVRYRKKPIQINLIDFLSMYPTVCIIQDLWKYIKCDTIKVIDDTKAVRKFVEDIELIDLQNPNTWKKLNRIVQVLPNNDKFPIRSKYGNKNTYNIGINKITKENPLWYTLAEVVSSKLLSGKNPEIIKAYRFIPEGIQDGLKPIKIVGNKKLNPKKDDLFKALIEYRKDIQKKIKDSDKDNEQLDNLQNIIKIISNSTSYGIFVEINGIKQNNTKVKVYGNTSYTVVKDSIETFGKAFNPLVSTLITSASRLILAITERILTDHKSFYAFCDTDSMAIPPDMVEIIQEFFQPLNPYSTDEKLFKLEKENFIEGTKELEPLYFYGISAKRYVLYNLKNGKPKIRKASSHGLGHLTNPLTNDKSNKKWHEGIWLDILNLHYGFTTLENINDKYSQYYAISRLTISSMPIMKRFEIINNGKPYHKQLKPFNFYLIGTNNNPESMIKPITPYTTDFQSIVYNDFIDYNTGNILSGIQYWKPLSDLVFEYLSHPESKFDGDTGLLKRKHIFIKDIIHIGKESNKLEESFYFGVQNDSYETYIPEIKLREKLNEFILKIPYKTAIKYGIPKRTIMDLRYKANNKLNYRISNKIKYKLNQIRKYEKIRV